MRTRFVPVAAGLARHCARRGVGPERSGVPPIGARRASWPAQFVAGLGELRGLGREGDSPPGFQDYLEKPIEPNVLLERIASALAARGAGKPAGA